MSSSLRKTTHELGFRGAQSQIFGADINETEDMGDANATLLVRLANGSEWHLLIEQTSPPK